MPSSGRPVFCMFFAGISHSTDTLQHIYLFRPENYMFRKVPVVSERQEQQMLRLINLFFLGYLSDAFLKNLGPERKLVFCTER